MNFTAEKKEIKKRTKPKQIESDKHARKSTGIGCEKELSNLFRNY
jgi:hypothetical protein